MKCSISFFHATFAFLAIINAPLRHSPGHLFRKKIAQNEKRKKKLHWFSNTYIKYWKFMEHFAEGKSLISEEWL